MDQKENNGPWIFISHSVKDWDKVRTIRNNLENEGAKPLMFFLKCLNEECEIDGLIKREITERNFFLLCESKNTLDSKWVKTEVEFVKSLKDKVIEVIDLENDLESQKFKINRLLKRATVFLSYAHIDFFDSDFIKDLQGILLKNDFAVYKQDEDSSTDFSWNTTNDIIEAMQNGFFIVLITMRSLRSNWVLAEINTAIENLDSKKQNIIPILLHDPKLVIPLLPKALREIQYYDFSNGDIISNANNLIKDLKKREMF